MKNRSLNIIIFTLISFSCFGQMDTRATLTVTGNTVSVFVKPFTSVIPFPNVSNFLNSNLAVSIPVAGNPVAPVATPTSTQGLSINPVPAVQINSRWVYTYIISGGVNAMENWAVNSENLIFTVSFSSTVPGTVPRLDNLLDTGNSYFFFELNGTQRSDTEGTPFYDGAVLGDYGNGNAFVESANPLPITLKSFDAKKHSASSAKLDWTTSKEVNSDYFGIERSIDGSTWDEIARVKAAGDSNVDIAYDYIDDRLPLSRTNGQVFYYRLRMTDLDGAFKYSDVRGVNFDKQALGPISIYPNPTTEIVNIDLSEVVMEDGDVYVSVYDMSGRLVMTKKIIGSGIELIKVDQLPSDAYNFIIRQGEQIHQQRVIKID